MRTSTNSWPVRAVAIAFAAAVLVGFGLPAGADLVTDHELTYEADTDNGYLHVESGLVVTNRTRDERRGNQIIQYYYDSIVLYVPVELENFSAVSGGTQLDYSLDPTDEPDTEGLLAATVKFGRRLFNGRSMDLTIAYDISGDAPRSESAFRINPAYVSFPVVAFGDPGRVNVNVVIPKGFEVETYGEDPTSKTESDNHQIIRFEGIEEFEDFFVGVSGWNDDALLTRTITFDDYDVAVRSWPNDADWQTEVTRYVEVGLPELQELIGLPWTQTDELSITESLEVAIAGYGGWYLEDLNAIHLSEWQEPHLVLHELAHAWFDGDTFRERWINEGLADQYAALAMVDSGLDDGSELRETTPLRGSHIALNDWVVPLDAFDPTAPEGEIGDYEEYGYQASWWVVQEIVDEIGADSMTAVLAAADNGEIAYRGEVEPEIVNRPGDWKLFLDLVEEVGGSETATELFERFVVDGGLEDRTEARLAYSELETRADGWSQPLYMRELMARWEFDSALDEFEEAHAVLDTRDEITANVTTLGVEIDPELEEAYENSEGDLVDVQALADENAATSADVVEAMEARDRERSFLMTVGLIGEDVDAEYDQSLAALRQSELESASTEAAEVVALVDESERVGQTRLMIAGATLLVIVLATFFVVRRLRRRRHLTEDGPEPSV